MLSRLRFLHPQLSLPSATRPVATFGSKAKSWLSRTNNHTAEREPAVESNKTPTQSEWEREASSAQYPMSEVPAPPSAALPISPNDEWAREASATQYTSSGTTFPDISPPKPSAVSAPPSAAHNDEWAREASTQYTSSGVSFSDISPPKPPVVDMQEQEGEQHTGEHQDAWASGSKKYRRKMRKLMLPPWEREKLFPKKKKVPWQTKAHHDSHKWEAILLKDLFGGGAPQGDAPPGTSKSKSPSPIGSSTVLNQLRHEEEILRELQKLNSSSDGDQQLYDEKKRRALSRFQFPMRHPLDPEKIIVYTDASKASNFSERVEIETNPAAPLSTSEIDTTLPTLLTEDLEDPAGDRGIRVDQEGGRTFVSYREHFSMVACYFGEGCPIKELNQVWTLTHKWSSMPTLNPEVVAWMMAIELVRKHCPEFRRVEIRTDYRSSNELHTQTLFEFAYPLLRQEQVSDMEAEEKSGETREMHKLTDFEIVWVQHHSGASFGNEKANAMPIVERSKPRGDWSLIPKDSLTYTFLREEEERSRVDTMTELEKHLSRLSSIRQAAKLKYGKRGAQPAELQPSKQVNVSVPSENSVSLL